MTSAVAPLGRKTIHSAEALVLNCMDYRLTSAVNSYLAGRGLDGKYDQITLAGAALGVMSGKTPAWAASFFEHVALARKLHGIRKIIVIDHRDCGACKTFVNRNCGDDRDKEFAIHVSAMEQLAKEIRTRAPDLEVELLLMDLDGSVDRLDAKL